MDRKKQVEALILFMENRGLEPETKYFVGEVLVEISQIISDDLIESINSFAKKLPVKIVYRRKGIHWYQWTFPY